jgi:predicted membrane protein
MNTQGQPDEQNQPKNNGRILAGFFLLIIGAVFVMKEMSFPFFPYWLFTWPMLLIAIGLYTGIKHQFRNPAWIILIIIGGVFLADQVDIGFNFHRFLFPIIIIGVGLIMITRPRHRRDRQWKDWGDNMKKKYSDYPNAGDAAQNSSDDFFDSTSIFGGTKKVIVSKNFRGGDITCLMGGCEADLTQADMQSTAIIDVTQIFGGTKLIVPSHWQVRTDMTAIFGAVEDKRQQPLNTDSGKLLILKGTTIFGGIEIRNY